MADLKKTQGASIQTQQSLPQGSPVAQPVTTAPSTPSRGDTYQLVTPAYQSAPLASFFEKHASDIATIKDFLERRHGWFNDAQSGGRFSPVVTAGIAQYRHLASSLITAIDKMKQGATSPIRRSEWWQPPDMVAALDEQLTVLAPLANVVDILITVSHAQRESLAKHPSLANATLLSELALNEFFTGFQSALRGDPSGQHQIERAVQHVELLGQHEQLTQDYTAAVSQLKQYTSPLVGDEVLWRGHYTANGHSSLPIEHLNAMPLHKAYQHAQRPKAWDDTFKTLNRYPITDEHQTSEILAGVKWNEQTEDFVFTKDDPWIKLAETVERREKAIATIAVMVSAAKPFATGDASLKDAIRQLEGGIKEAHELTAAMDKIFEGRLLPSIQDYRDLLKPSIAHLNRADSAITLAAGAMHTGDEVRALNYFQRALGSYALAIETPAFRSLQKAAANYESLSQNTEVGILVGTTLLSGGAASLAAAGARGALISYGASAATIGATTLLVSSTTFSLSSLSLNNLLINEPFPKGISGWTYELGSTVVLFGALGKIDRLIGRPFGAWATNGIAQKMGPLSTHKWLQHVPRWGGALAEMTPTYGFFAGVWSPLDGVGHQFMNEATFTPETTLSNAYSWESFKKQGFFLWALRLGNGYLGRTPIFKTLEERLSRVTNARIETLVASKEASDRQLHEFHSRWRENPTETVGEGAALMRQAATATHKLADFLSLFDAGPSAMMSRQLNGQSRTYAEHANEFQIMSVATSILKHAKVAQVAPGLAFYDPVAHEAIRSLCNLKSNQFSVRDSSNGIFILTWKGHLGETAEITLTPKAESPISTATEMQPWKP